MMMKIGQIYTKWPDKEYKSKNTFIRIEVNKKI